MAPGMFNGPLFIKYIAFDYYSPDLITVAIRQNTNNRHYTIYTGHGGFNSIREERDQGNESPGHDNRSIAHIHEHCQGGFERLKSTDNFFALERLFPLQLDEERARRRPQAGGGQRRRRHGELLHIPGDVQRDGNDPGRH